MPYPLATHVHKLSHQPNRRIIAGVMLTAATIVAVVSVSGHCGDGARRRAAR